MWTDKGIPFGAEWARTIEGKLRECVVFVPVMSPRSREAEWVGKEILLALTLKKPILPLLLDGDRFMELLDRQDEDVSGGHMPSHGYVAALAGLAGTSVVAGSEANSAQSQASLPRAGRPRPDNLSEMGLEASLLRQPWAAGRAWNQTLRLPSWSSPIRADLLWADERVIVEIDGPEGRTRDRYEADRRRDNHLQSAGYAVLRFTTDQVVNDARTATAHIEHILSARRAPNNQ